ncbi:hypothetical protein B0H63DRAFT_456110 [Podospora didyma]|uniref:Chromo domain-containing protein n=1 Tax=Podospora didyma TaxID=330526 RepID=A0AAE0N1W2_9PEZI|nr:hypothetical protein B0H63DRAFT_456110 [Podospora didyma]
MTIPVAVPLRSRLPIWKPSWPTLSQAALGRFQKTTKLEASEKHQKGLHWGVEVLRASRDPKGVWYLVRWKGGEWKDDWVLEKNIHRELIQKLRPRQKAKRKKRKS